MNINNTTNISLSVWMITYNHENYIAQAIESVLSQKINFSLEIIIGEDNSSDKTASVIKEYEDRYPNIIKAKYNKSNLGMMGNMTETLKRCKGKYVALLEGDDYWSDINKLQKQVDLLEKRQEVSFCFHDATVTYENKQKEDHSFTELQEKYYNSSDVITDWIVATSSVVFRNTELTWPKFTNACVHGDILLFLLLLEKGDAYAFNENWSVYRKNDTSITNINFLRSSHIKEILVQIKCMNSYFNKTYNNEFKESIKYWRLVLIVAYYKNNKYIKSFYYLILYLINYPFSTIKKVTAKIR
jgi:glycosyltransferase involved in cell wall biosynthesis